jgi:hypothetical protein
VACIWEVCKVALETSIPTFWVHTDETVPEFICFDPKFGTKCLEDKRPFHRVGDLSIANSGSKDTDFGTNLGAE